MAGRNSATRRLAAVASGVQTHVCVRRRIENQVRRLFQPRQGMAQALDGWRVIAGGPLEIDVVVVLRGRVASQQIPMVLVVERLQ